MIGGRLRKSEEFREESALGEQLMRENLLTADDFGCGVYAGSSFVKQLQTAPTLFVSLK